MHKSAVIYQGDAGRRAKPASPVLFSCVHQDGGERDEKEK